jgi:hypothetical protein
MSNPDEENKILVDKNELEELAKKAAALENLSEEIKTVRGKKNEEIEALKKEVEQLKGSDEGKDVKAEIDKVLQERKKEDIVRMQKQALQDFRESHAEFSSDNDPGNLKFGQYEGELKKFNFEGLETKEEFTRRLKEVYDFYKRKSIPQEDKVNPYSFEKKPSSSTPTEPNNTLSDKEKRLIKLYNFTEEYYLKQRESKPAYVKNLLKFID